MVTRNAESHQGEKFSPLKNKNQGVVIVGHLSYVKIFLWTSWGRYNTMFSNLQTMPNK
jgi:hypothetical protein